MEEFRQKRQQKGSSNKPSTTTALKALTESDQTLEELYVDPVTSEVAGNERLQRVPSQTEVDGSRIESVKESAHQVEENYELQGSTTPPIRSPESCLPSPIQALNGGSHVCVETSEQIDSLCEPGSRNETSGDSPAEREAVYAILWENRATHHLPQNEAWQESTSEGAEHLDDRLVNQENYSTFRVDEHHGIEKREGLNTLESSSGLREEALEKLHAVEVNCEPFSFELDPSLCFILAGALLDANS